MGFEEDSNNSVSRTCLPLCTGRLLDGDVNVTFAHEHAKLTDRLRSHAVTIRVRNRRGFSAYSRAWHRATFHPTLSSILTHNVVRDDDLGEERTVRNGDRDTDTQSERMPSLSSIRSFASSDSTTPRRWRRSLRRSDRADHCVPRETRTYAGSGLRARAINIVANLQHRDES